MALFGQNTDEFLEFLGTYLTKDVGADSQALHELPTKLMELDKLGHQDVCQKAVELLGTAVGGQKSLQIPFKEAGILGYTLKQLDPLEASVELTRQYLRVIGNCIADNDENRAVALDSFQKLIDCFRKDDLTPTAIAVILNLCNEFDPAQIQAARLRLDSTISELLVANKITNSDGIDHAVDLLTWTTSSLSPAEIQDSSSTRTVNHILDLALAYDEDHYDDYIAVCLYYLEDAEFQQKATETDLPEKVFDVLLDYESRLKPGDIHDVFRAMSGKPEPAKLDSGGSDTVMVQLINCLSAISATDAFAKRNSMTSPFIRKVKSKMLSLSTSPSTVCACIILGNLAISDEVAIEMVEDMGIHLTLIGILSARKESSLLYAAAGLMRHLAFPEENRRVLGEAGLIETCCYLLVNADPSVRGEGAAILGKLVTSNYENIEQIVYETMPEDITPAAIPGMDVPVQPTILYHMVTQALVRSAPLPSTSMKSASVEIGRAIVNMLRYLHQSDLECDVEPLLRHMYKTPLVAKPLAQLARQGFFAEARSDGLLGLGLMVQSHEGAACVVDCLKADRGLLVSLQDLFNDEGNAKEQARIEGLSRDQQNAFVLLHGLVINGTYVMDPETKSDVEAMQTELEQFLL
ncbi:ARM repeat-containing protein [Lepidopterella palustris CBS 459.81]|uniref:ARM repeat-containing protein n=1 Tax=Lepidopterella palustris CBS 459.81 TaxID=1314670 RepID=A0A8E2JBS4_9PEZI|nr:ARM repeat-containing protein [Lepidopterella palustris CBS 459.81]